MTTEMRLQNALQQNVLLRFGNDSAIGERANVRSGDGECIAREDRQRRPPETTATQTAASQKLPVVFLVLFGLLLHLCRRSAGSLSALFQALAFRPFKANHSKFVLHFAKIARNRRPSHNMRPFCGRCVHHFGWLSKFRY